MTPRTLLIALAIVLCAAAPAQAYFRTSGTGTGTGPVDTLGAGLQPTTSANGRTVTVTWTQTTFHGDRLGTFAGGGYALTRYPSAGGAGTTPSAPCATTITGTTATLSCAEPNVPLGSWRYTVSPRLGSSWTGTESPQSTAVTVSPDAPVITAKSAAAGRIDVSWTTSAGATSYKLYRRAGSGALTLLATQTGTTYADTATTNGTTYGYVVRAVAATESADSNEATAVADATGPSVTMTNPGATLRGTITLAATVSDTGTGVASVRFQASPAGANSWYDACSDATAPFQCDADTTQAPDGLYDFRAIATDNAGNSTTSATIINRRIDNTAPAVSLSTPATYLRGTVSLAYTATDGGSGLASVKVQRAPTGTSTWTDICSSTAAASPCSFTTTSVPDGVYDLRVLATDAAGNTGTSASTGITVDNTRPVGTDVQAANKAGGTAGYTEAGDSITFTTSEPLAPASILAGWTGAATNVTVRISAASPGVLTVYNAANSTQIPLGTVSLGGRYALLATTFSNSPMTMNGSTITITLGTSQTGGLATVAGAGTMAWTTSTTPTDLAGNALTAGTVTETGSTDVDF